MGFLDAYDTFVSNKCQEISAQNNTLTKLKNSLGLANLTNGVEKFVSNGVIESLKNSPLRELGEDIIAQTINENSRRLTQNVLNQVPEKLTNTLTDIRSAAFGAVFSVLTFKNDMVLYFASVVAQQCVSAIKDKRNNLISLKEAIKNLHNALLVLAGNTSPFFNDYIKNLREALVLLDQADKELLQLRSAFFSTDVFSKPNYNRSKEYLDKAYQLILPPVTGEDAKEINQGFLKGVLKAPSYGRQLSMLMTIPKLTMEMLGAYDLYAVKVLKVNVLLIGFQSIVQNLKAVSGGKFKDVVLKQIDSSRDFLEDIIQNMALNLNGDATSIDGPVQVPVGISRVRSPEGFFTNQGSIETKLFAPNPTKTSARATIWGIKIKTLQVMLSALDANALQTINLSNNALREYNLALEALSKLDDRYSTGATLMAVDGREEIGDIEADFITFAFQANQALLDTSLLKGKNFNDKTVLALGAKLNARLQLSIDQDREIENILLKFIAAMNQRLSGIKELGDSIFRMMDDLGMDRAADFLKRGAIGDFFSMTGKTSTYVGAAITGLSALQALASTEETRQCIANAINKLEVEETSKKLSSQRAVASNYVKQQKQNEVQCETLKKDFIKTEGCSVGFDIKDLKSNPMKSLTGMFRGVFGGDISEKLQGSSIGNMREASLPAGLGGVVNSKLDPKAVQGVKSNQKYANEASVQAHVEADKSEKEAKKAMVDAINKVEGFKASENESFDALINKASSASRKDKTGETFSALQVAYAAEDKIKEANDLDKNAASTTNAFAGS